MKNAIQDKELKTFLENAHIPDIDVKQDVMAAINSGPNPFRIKRNRTLVLVTLIIILLCCSAFTIGYRVWELQNANGEVIMKVHESDRHKPVLVFNQYDELSNLVKPGESVFVYDARNKEPSVTTFCKPLSLNSVDEARKHVPFDFKIPSSPPHGYRLASIDVQTAPIKEPDLEAFKQEAEASGKNFLTKAIGESEGSKHLIFKYAKDKNEILLTVFRAEGIDMYTDISNKKTIKNIKIGNMDALYYKDKNILNLTLREEIHGTEHTRKIVKDGKNFEEVCKYYIQYDAFIGPDAKDVTEDDLISLLESMKY